ncbi:hypothetical protein ACQR16_15935 [Bradyrhizobium oligotrophicum]|uniref:hypothetical protein n=1 Tax=Bradyrhizobium oligotrophicum TaxID=44255 RepID=UPI003EBFC107
MKSVWLTIAATVALQPCAATASDTNTFRACVVREAKAALNRAFTKFGEVAFFGYHNDENAQVFATCKLRPFNGAISSDIDDAKFVSETTDKIGRELALESMRKADEMQRQRDALDMPRLRAEKALEDQAAQNYLLCLDSSTRVLSVSSSEPAEVIAQAAFASCVRPRQRVFDAYRGHTNSFSLETMEAMEQVFRRQLLLVVVEARASRDVQPPAPAGPAPTRHETRI